MAYDPTLADLFTDDVVPRMLRVGPVRVGAALAVERKRRAIILIVTWREAPPRMCDVGGQEVAP